MDEKDKAAIRKLAKNMVMQGEFIASLHLTRSIGEPPIWVSSDGKRSLRFRDEQ